MQFISLQRVSRLFSQDKFQIGAISKRNYGYNDLLIRDLPCVVDPGQPQLPMKAITVKLPKNAEILGMEIESGSYREILNAVNLTTGSEPHI